MGRRGKNIEAIRTLTRSTCCGENLRVSVEVVNAADRRVKAMSWFVESSAQLFPGSILLSYLTLCCFSVYTTCKMDDAGAHIKAMLLVKFLSWLGVGVIGVVILSAAGSFVLLFVSVVLYTRAR